MSITAIYQELFRHALRTGEARGQTLSKGARLTVRAKDGVVTLTISRKTKRVGDSELEVFKRDCGVPADAERRPAEGQNTMEHAGDTWWYIAYRWLEDWDD